MFGFSSGSGLTAPTGRTRRENAECAELVILSMIDYRPHATLHRPCVYGIL